MEILVIHKFCIRKLCKNKLNCLNEINFCVNLFSRMPILIFFFYVEQFSQMKEFLKLHVNKIWCFFSIWVFFHKHSWFTGQQWIGDAVSLSPFHHLPLNANHAKFLSSLWIRLEFFHSSYCARKDSCAFKNRYTKVR